MAINVVHMERAVTRALIHCSEREEARTTVEPSMSKRFRMDVETTTASSHSIYDLGCSSKWSTCRTSTSKLHIPFYFQACTRVLRPQSHTIFSSYMLSDFTPARVHREAYVPNLEAATPWRVTGILLGGREKEK